jgi:hypothetical protein
VLNVTYTHNEMVFVVKCVARIECVRRVCLGGHTKCSLTKKKLNEPPHLCCSFGYIRRCQIMATSGVATVRRRKATLLFVCYVIYRFSVDNTYEVEMLSEHPGTSSYRHVNATAL